MGQLENPGFYLRPAFWEFQFHALERWIITIKENYTSEGELHDRKQRLIKLLWSGADVLKEYKYISQSSHIFMESAIIIF